MITVRPRTADDLPSCITALRAVHEADGYPAGWPEDPAAWLSPSKQLDARVAEADGAIVGQVGIGTSALPPQVRAAAPESTLASVIRLFVTPPHRRRGTGRHLLTAAVTMAHGRGYRAILDVEVGATAARSLYESAGWTRIHTAPGNWTTTDGRPATLLYYLSP
ncbi:GNAT family N-acetyltransferase [Nocardia sp. NPDC058176]|uniref:GNAT family N-acetyltransferase n=1 Tax=Nocardia sp. NPDC058176 TaxID=3346368 RepID=UPI0036DCBC5B